MDLATNFSENELTDPVENIVIEEASSMDESQRPEHDTHGVQVGTEHHLIVDSGDMAEPSPSHNVDPMTVVHVPERLTRKSLPLNANRIKLMDIDDRLYSLYCEITLKGMDSVEFSAEEEEKINSLADTGDLGVAQNIVDEFLGEIPSIMVHIPSTKYLLPPRLRTPLLEKVIEHVRNRKEPLGLALQIVQKDYVGYPPLLQLRNLLFQELERQLPLAIPEQDKKTIRKMPVQPGTQAKRKRPLPPNPTGAKKQAKLVADDGANNQSTSSDPPATTSPSTSEDNQTAASDASVPSTSATNPPAIDPEEGINIFAPIDDHIYQLLAETINTTRSLDSIENPVIRTAISERLNGDLISEFWDEPRDFCRDGWRLIHANNRKIVPRKSEVGEIWSNCIDAMSTADHNRVHTFLKTMYVGLEMSQIPITIRPPVTAPVPGSERRAPGRPRKNVFSSSTEKNVADESGAPAPAHDSSPPAPSLAAPVLPPPLPFIKKVRIDIRAPVEDTVYDVLCEVIAGSRTLSSIEDIGLRMGISDRCKGEVLAEFWDSPKDYCPPGWRLIDRQSRKIIPRKGEVNEIWRNCYSKMAPSHSQADILNYLDSVFIGISNKQMLRETARHDVLRGNRVMFPRSPLTLGTKPLQYVQIDIVDMDEVLYGDRYFVQALFVTDLYSGYVFGRALAECTERPSTPIVRNLMDVFTTFGPPEAYRSSSVSLGPTVIEVMYDIENMFKVSIKNVGFAADCTTGLVKNIYRRAQSDRGSRERWVEALPFAIIEWNQKPAKVYDMRLSAFEVMFGRRPWRNEEIPPWIDAGEVEDEKARHFAHGTKEGKQSDEMGLMVKQEGEETKRKRGRKTQAFAGLMRVKAEPMEASTMENTEEKKTSGSKPPVPLERNREQIESLTRMKYSPVFDEDGNLYSPGTGYLFKVGDKVFVRNTMVDWRFVRTKKVGVPRYYRGCILQVDPTNVEFLYKVLYWQDDAKTVDEMQSSAWPAPGDGFDCLESWFSPWDVTASTPYLAGLRSVAIQKSTTKYQSEDLAAESESEGRCQCGVAGCVSFRHEKCPFKLAAKCCMKRPDTCVFHLKPHLRGTAPTAGGGVIDPEDPMGGNLSLVLFNRMRTRAKMIGRSCPGTAGAAALTSVPIVPKPGSSSSSAANQVDDSPRFILREGKLVKAKKEDLVSTRLSLTKPATPPRKPAEVEKLKLVSSKAEPRNDSQYLTEPSTSSAPLQSHSSTGSSHLVRDPISHRMVPSDKARPRPAAGSVKFVSVVDSSPAQGGLAKPRLNLPPPTNKKTVGGPLVHRDASGKIVERRLVSVRRFSPNKPKLTSISRTEFFQQKMSEEAALATSTRQIKKPARFCD